MHDHQGNRIRPIRAGHRRLGKTDIRDETDQQENDGNDLKYSYRSLGEARYQREYKDRARYQDKSEYGRKYPTQAHRNWIRL